MTGIRCDVLVVGAGPAGAMTALALARQGVDTLLVDDDRGAEGGGDTGYDVILSAPTQRALATVGALDEMRLVPADVELRLGDTAGRPLADAGAAVCDRHQLSDALRQAAAAASATFLPGRVVHLDRHDDAHHATVARPAPHLRPVTPTGAGTGAGAGAAHDGRPPTVAGGRGGTNGHATLVEVVARHVVMATGAMGAHDAGARRANSGELRDGAVGADSPGPAGWVAPHAVGFACARRFRVSAAARGRWEPRIVLVLPPPGTIDPRERPTCMWLLPGADGTCTVGASRIGDAPATGSDRALRRRGWPPDGATAPTPARALMATAVATLVAVHGPDLPVDSDQPVGPLVSGPVSSGFAPGGAVRDQRLLVGDAAGLVNPFTGEGLSSALQSGLLAARSIADHRHDPGAAGRTYAHRLTTTFVGHFETAHHAARRYHLAWRVLAATATSDRPLFAKARRAVLMPDGLAGLTADERMDLPTADGALLAPFLLACDEVAIATVRREWPFLARLLVAGDMPHQRLRPAVAFFAGLVAAGAPPPVTQARLGAAVELATLGALAFLGPETVAERPGPGRAVDWATATTVLAGDFLLSQASRLVAEAAPEASWPFADWLAELTALRAARLDPASPVAAADLFASLLEFPTRLGGQLGGAPPEVVRALRDAGHHCGRATLHADDVLALQGRRTRLDASLAALLESRISTLPDLLDDPAITGERLAADPRLRSAALEAATAACREAHGAAVQALADVPDRVAARILRQFATTAAAPALPQGPGPFGRGLR